MNKPEYSAWNPGIVSSIPIIFEELETIFHADNTFTNIAEIRELARETGLKAEELVVFKPARLALHEVIIRITADIVVLESESEEGLGINFRLIADKILNAYIKPNLAEIENSYESMQQSVRAQIDAEISAAFFTTEAPKNSKPGFWSFFDSKKKKPVAAMESPLEKQLRNITAFKEKGLCASDPQTSAIYRSMYRVLGAIASKRGYLGQDKSLLIELCSRHVCNFYGARLIGKIVHRLALTAIEEQHYSMIPDAENAVLISLKGTSAAGKSSLRPRLSEMMAELGMTNGSYGTISPDIWRRLLLDYESLGDAFKYAGRLTSYEVIIIDSKLDQYIRGKAEVRQSIPHLMVDRFRFDSFSSEKVSRVLHRTYVRYIDTMYMYFVITPPEATVERGWTRGQARGRYKSVEDFLGHSVEAYEGIPKLLFKYLSSTKPRYVFEFLDNSVPIDHYPLLIAKGTQGHIDIYDPVGFINIVRYQKINIMAKTVDEVYKNSERFLIAANLEFIKQCIAGIKIVRFIDQNSSEQYLEFESGRMRIVNQTLLRAILQDSELREILTSLEPALATAAASNTLPETA